MPSKIRLGQGSTQDVQAHTELSAGEGIALNEVFTGDGTVIYKHACALGCGKYCVEAVGLALPRWVIEPLAQGQEPSVAGRKARGRRGVSMSGDSSIYIDASRPATLNDGAGKLTDCSKRLFWLGTPCLPSRRA